MSKTLVRLAAVAAAAATFGTVASPASADDSGATFSVSTSTGVSQTYTCQTPWRFGGYGQYGAWGNFIDGCTVKLSCPSMSGTVPVRKCDVSEYSYIDNYYHRGERVTMNGRIRRYDAGGHSYSWSDRSCDLPDRCSVSDSSVIAAGQSAAVVCNGVRSATSNNWAKDSCSVTLNYSRLDSTSQQGSGQCTDWALYRRPDLANVVSGDAWKWRDEARNAGRHVSKTPSVGALVVFQPGVLGAGATTGHVAYVEKLRYDNWGYVTSFDVSEQNSNGVLTPTTRNIQMSTVPSTGVDFIG